MAIDKAQRRILLGEIAGVHGIRGDVLVRTFTAEPEAIASYGPLSDATGRRRFTLSIIRSTGKGVVARIAGITDRNAAEALRGTELYIERGQLPEAAASEYYHADLVGLRAVAPDGGEIGEIVGVENFGAGDLIELKPSSGGPTEFIPFETQWVPEIDLATGRIVIIRQATNEDGDDGEADSPED